MKSYRLLYAEDNPLDAELTLTHFAEYAPGIEIEVVSTGQSCMERLGEASFDLLLLDYRLPDIDGLEVLKWLAKTGLSVPVVLVTGSGDEELVGKALRLGAVNYVAKGQHYLDSLPEQLCAVLEEHRAKQAPGVPVANDVRKILYVEHLAMDIELTLSHFSEAVPHFVLDVVQSCASALERLSQAHDYDLVLIDLRMPDQSGLELVGQIRRLRLKMPPFLMISGQGNESMALAAMKLGAADYLSKHPGYLEQLPHRIDHAIAQHRLNSINLQLRSELAERKLVEQNLLIYQSELEMQNEQLRQTEARLEDAQQRYFDLFDHAPVSYCTVSIQGLILQANLAAVALLGVYQRFLVNDRITQFILKQDQDIYYLFSKRLFDSGQPRTCELRMVKSDGTEFWAHLSAALAFDEDGTPELRVMVRDISERKLIEHNLKDSETFKRSILDSMPSQIAVLDHQGVIVAVNEVWQRFALENSGKPGQHARNTEVGVNYLEICLASFGDIDEGAQEVHEGILAVLEGRLQSFSIEYPCHSPNEQRWFLASVTPLGIEYRGVVITHTNITERKLAENELRIAAIAFETQTGMVVTDANAVILRINKAFTKLTGYTEAESLGQTPHMLSSGQHDKLFFETLWNDLINTGYWEGQIWNRRKDGNIVVEWLAISAVMDAHARVSHYIGVYSHIIHNLEAIEEIHRLAYYDPLTKLPNRRLLQDRLSQALAVSTRNRLYGAILFLDLDHFKQINDTRGHEAGDLLLIEVARRLRNVVREVDTLARLGGDEFVVLLEDLDTDVEVAASLVKQVAGKVLGVLAEPYLIHCNEQDYNFHCSASIGIGLYIDKLTPEELLGHADLAMYEAKSGGRNALRFFDMTMQEVVTARTSLEQDLRQALAHQEFKLYFQMQALHNRRIIGAEVLLRWAHPERGLVSPRDFIPLAEQTGLILPIGLWVLETACAQLKTWEAVPLARDLQLAVNVSAHQFHQECFVEQVCAALERYAIQPDRLKLELTESLVLDDIEDTISKMLALKTHGVSFSMNDFGTGFSSLSYLTKLPLNQLKIDQSFVRNLGVKHSDAVIVQTIISMGNNLGMEVIAEGVETEEQRAFLELHGCPAIQGYLIGRPVPLEEFERQLNR